MAASKAGSRRQVLPFPSSNRDKQNALKKHQEAQRRGLPIPHFRKKDGSIHYFDNKGNGYRFNDLATKLANEAARKANKTASKPTLEHYTEAYGSKLGKQLFDAEQKALKKAYRNTPSTTHDVDHINSFADGGVHHSRNLRAQNKTTNRSEGARGLTLDQKVALNQASTPQDQIRLQGPNMTPYQRQKFLREQASKIVYRNDNAISALNFASPAYGGIARATNSHADSTAVDMGFKLAD